MSQGFPSSSKRHEKSASSQREDSSAAIRRLAHLAASIDPDTKLAKKPQHFVLSRWEEAGQEDYIPFIQMNAAEREGQLRRKQEKAAERRRAKEEKYSRLVGRSDASQVPASSQMLPPLLAQTQVPQSSQAAPPIFSQATIPFRPREGEAASSQVGGLGSGSGLGFTMSQPVSGAFGQRRLTKKKKKKKKTGIK
jgi:RNA polymerase I-specific transcription initiation factor RRN6